MKIFGVRKRFYIPPILLLIFGYLSVFYFPNVEVDHVYKVCPVFTIYTDSFLEQDQSGTCRGLVVIIRPEYRDDKTVKTHELVHAKQAYRGLFFNWVRAAYDRQYLAKIECEAYATEIKNTNQIPYYAHMIQKEYAPNVQYEIIKDYLYYYVQQ